MFCEVCLRVPYKYKCSKCLLKYCSVDCYKVHSTSGSDECETKRRKRIEEEGRKEIKTIEKEEDRQRKEKQQEDDDDVVGDRVPIHSLELLRSDSRLLDCLRNPHLRNLISTLDRSSNPSMDVLSAMMEPIFVEFADHCLRIVETPPQPPACVEFADHSLGIVETTPQPPVCVEFADHFLRIVDTLPQPPTLNM